VELKMYFNLHEDLKIAIESGYLCYLGLNEFAVLLVLQTYMNTPLDDVTISTQDIFKYTGLSIGAVIRAIKSLESKNALKRNQPIDIGTTTYFVTTSERIQKSIAKGMLNCTPINLTESL
jgi:DNA-binding MarR family transcriptional regulator